MRITKLISIASISLGLAASANAQFSVSGGGSAIPASGSGGDALAVGDGGATYDTTQAGLEAISAVAVANPVTSITSIQIDGLAHSWIGDTQATLEDPTGVEHLIWLRPGYLATGNFGNSGDFDGGTYTIVGDGSGASLPTTSGGTGAAAGTYNQSFTSGGATWVSGTNGINNTPMASIAGPAGSWSLHIYDWGGGDSGSFTGWTLNGMDGGGGPNTGAGYCSGDGTGVACPCAAVGSAGAGCPNSVGTSGLLVGSGDADAAGDTFVLTTTGLPVHNFGVYLTGSTQGGAPFGEGILCMSGQIFRFTPAFTDPSGSAILGPGLSGAILVPGSPQNYQFYYRDNANSCAGGGFNTSNAWSVTWN